MERFETIGEKVSRLLFGFLLWGVLAVVAIGALAWCGGAQAMPRLSQQGCALVADVAITSRAMARNSITRDAALPVLTDMYEVNLHPYIGEVLDAAYREAEKRTAKEFARELLGTCFENGGDLDKFLGVPL